LPFLHLLLQKCFLQKNDSSHQTLKMSRAQTKKTKTRPVEKRSDFFPKKSAKKSTFFVKILQIFDSAAKIVFFIIVFSFFDLQIF
jgi:hypothetical protein